MDSILVEQREHITIISINRPLKKNSIDRPTAQELTKAFLKFDADPTVLPFSTPGTTANLKLLGLGCHSNWSW